MSPTPRTDEVLLAWTTEDGSDIVFASTARELETELASMTTRAEKAEAALAAEREKVKVMREALSYVAWLPVSNQAEIARDALAATKEASK